MPYQRLADAVLVVHFGVVVFVVGGLVAVIVGNWLGWRWVNGWWFRLAHLAAIAIVVAQAWFGELCPLTTLESWLRVRGGTAGYSASFIQHWFGRLIFHEAPFWVFTLAYTVFAALVLAAWWYFPPTGRVSGRSSSGRNPALPAVEEGTPPGCRSGGSHGFDLDEQARRGQRLDDEQRRRGRR